MKNDMLELGSRLPFLTLFAFPLISFRFKTIPAYQSSLLTLIDELDIPVSSPDLGMEM